MPEDRDECPQTRSPIEPQGSRCKTTTFSAFGPSLFS
jgi:hypothetical protein